MEWIIILRCLCFLLKSRVPQHARALYHSFSLASPGDRAVFQCRHCLCAPSKKGRTLEGGGGAPPPPSTALAAKRLRRKGFGVKVSGAWKWEGLGERRAVVGRAGGGRVVAGAVAAGGRGVERARIVRGVPSRALFFFAHSRTFDGTPSFRSPYLLPHSPLVRPLNTAPDTSRRPDHSSPHPPWCVRGNLKGLSAPSKLERNRGRARAPPHNTQRSGARNRPGPPFQGLATTRRLSQSLYG